MGKDTGGQAFPQAESEHYYGSEGMTLRDYFAGQFLTSFQISGGAMQADEVVEKCYRIADAMIAERSKG